MGKTIIKDKSGKVLHNLDNKSDDELKSSAEVGSSNINIDVFEKRARAIDNRSC